LTASRRAPSAVNSEWDLVAIGLDLKPIIDRFLQPADPSKLPGDTAEALKRVWNPGASTTVVGTGLFGSSQP